MVRIWLTPGIPLPFPESPLGCSVDGQSHSYAPSPSVICRTSREQAVGMLQQAIISNLILSNLSSKQLFCNSVSAKELRRWVWCQLGIHPSHGESLCDLQSCWHGQHGQGTEPQHCSCLAGLENILCAWGCGWDSDSHGAAGKTSLQLTPALGNWRGAGAEL